MLYLSVIFPLIAYLLPIRNKNVKLLISIAPAVYIILFRFALGTDYFSYEYLYNNHNISSFSIAMEDQARSMEKVFRFLIYVFKSMGFSFQAFVASISLFIYGFVVRWIYDSEQDLSLSIMLYNGMFFVVWTLGALRQGVVLAIGTYIIFNKNEKFNFWVSAILILLLGQVHASAYIYLFLLVVKKIKLNRNILLGMMLLSLLSTIVPYYKLFLPFDHIRVVGKFLTYVTGSNGFWDFAGLSRLFFVVIIFVFYNRFAKEKYIKLLADTSLIGFSLYFLLKTSEITASRVHSFTFILIIPLFVYLMKEFEKNKVLRLFAISALFLFSMLYLEKSLIATQREAGNQEFSYYYKMKLFNEVEYEDYYMYDNQYAVLAYNTGLCRDIKKITHPLQTPSEEGYMVVFDHESRMYGVIDNTGKWAIEPAYLHKPVILGNILELKSSDYRESYLALPGRDLTRKPWVFDELKERQNIINGDLPTVEPVEIHGYENKLMKFFTNLDNVEELSIKRYKFPFEYNTLSLRYSNNNYHFFLNKDLVIQNNLVFTEDIRFSVNNLSSAKTFCGYVILNSNGDIIYK